MARKVFFSFHYEDVATFRANVVRNSWMTHNRGNINSFSDSSIWERAKLNGDAAIKSLIDNNGLFNTSVTAILIGSDTSNRRWVKYEIIKSFERGNGIFGIHINRIRDKTGYITARGLNPLDRLAFEISNDGKKITFYELVNNRWQLFSDLPQINNKQSNSLHFPEGFIYKNPKWGNSFKLSEYFKTYCWNFDDGYNEISKWVSNSADQVGK